MLDLSDGGLQMRWEAKWILLSATTTSFNLCTQSGSSIFHCSHRGVRSWSRPWTFGLACNPRSPEDLNVRLSFSAKDKWASAKQVVSPHALPAKHGSFDAGTSSMSIVVGAGNGDEDV